MLPLVAIVGRPNVGKSTLFNRLTRSRRSIVGDEPGITRDRIYGKVTWHGREFRLADTGGVMPGDEATIPSAILRQARTAIDESAAVLMIVDGTTELAQPDLELARLLLKTGKPVLGIVNKMDGRQREQHLGAYYRLGLPELLPVSAEHSNGIPELLDRVLALLPPAQESQSPRPSEVEEREPTGSQAENESAAQPAGEPRETRIAIVGRPNVGKSTLLNRLTGEERTIVSPVAGTTRDAVDARLERNGAFYRLVDTAGIRRKGKTKLMAEKLSVVMARKHMEQADIALILLDGAAAEEGGVLSLDATIAGYAFEAGRSCIIAVNKWDLSKSLHRSQAEFEETIREKLKFLSFAPIVFISAEKGAGLNRLFSVLDRVARARNLRISTSAMNRFLAGVDFNRAQVPVSHRVRIYYMSQVRTAPPQFLLFIDKPRALHFSYRRFLENRIRDAFSFEGTPIQIRTKVSTGTPKRKG